MYKEGDKILLNLKIISKIPNYGRVRRDKNGVITLETNDMFTPMRRYFFSDGREQSVVDIMNIVVSAFSEIRNIVQGHISIQSEAQCYAERMYIAKALIRELSACKSGLFNLQNTYTDDVKTTAAIDMVCDKIDSFMATMRVSNEELFALPAYHDLPQTGSPPSNF